MKYKKILSSFYINSFIIFFLIWPFQSSANEFREQSELLKELEKIEINILTNNQNLTELHNKKMESENQIQNLKLEIRKLNFEVKALHEYIELNNDPQSALSLFFKLDETKVIRSLTFKKLQKKLTTQLSELKYKIHLIQTNLNALEQKKTEIETLNKNLVQQEAELKLKENQIVTEIRKKTFLEKNAHLLLYKKSLSMPVDYLEIKYTFGLNQVDSQFNFFNPGLLFKVTPLTKVFSIGPGVVIFNDFIAHRGQTLVLKHAGDYYSIYSGISGITLKRDQFVDFKTLLGKTISSEFYFELRHNLTPLNPIPWMKEK